MPFQYFVLLHFVFKSSTEDTLYWEEACIFFRRFYRSRSTYNDQLSVSPLDELDNHSHTSISESTEISEVFKREKQMNYSK